MGVYINWDIFFYFFSEKNNSISSQIFILFSLDCWLTGSFVVRILLRREDASVWNAFDRSFSRLLFVFALENVEFRHETALASFAFVKQTSFWDQTVFCSNGAEVVVASKGAISWLLLDGIAPRWGRRDCAIYIFFDATFDLNVRVKFFNFFFVIFDKILLFLKNILSFFSQILKFKDIYLERSLFELWNFISWASCLASCLFGLLA